MTETTFCDEKSGMESVLEMTSRGACTFIAHLGSADFLQHGIEQDVAVGLRNTWHEATEGTCVTPAPASKLTVRRDRRSFI